MKVAGLGDTTIRFGLKRECEAQKGVVIRWGSISGCGLHRRKSGAHIWLGNSIITVIIRFLREVGDEFY